MNNINIINIFIESLCLSFSFLINYIIIIKIYFSYCKDSKYHKIYSKLNKYYILNIIVFIFFLILYLMLEYNYLIK